MSITDALCLKNEMNPKSAVSLWKSPLEYMPDITIQDPDLGEE